MSKNIIFVFSGTGNSLWAAKEIAKDLSDCEIVNMGKPYQLQSTYDSIGLVCPTYAGGVPKRVKEFIKDVDFKINKSAYFFAVATCGRIIKAQNVVTQLYQLLKRRGITLNYGERLDMFSNYVVGYEMRETVKEEAEQSAADLKPMLENIKNHKSNQITAVQTSRKFESMGFWLIVNGMDKNFNVSNVCTNCGICKKVCPVNNIEINKDSKTQFLHHCEQCLACIQNCPTKAINYKNKTQNRRRYRHPDITLKEMIEMNL